MKCKTTYFLLLACLFACVPRGFAQEFTGPVLYNPVVDKANTKFKSSAAKGTATATLPFFDDFTDYSPLPSADRWVERQVYINNTMGVKPVSRGVATFDGLAANGLPYNTQNMNALVYADSLTSLPIDLSSRSAADNIYISFFYQPAGNGLNPEEQDSLALYFRKSTGIDPWERVWAVQGSTYQPFKQVIIPVNGADYFHADFQFRFVNKASLNINDDVWNLDYVRMDVNRNRGDTAVNDIAFTLEPSRLLNDYVSMPYSQFLANKAGELDATHYTAIRNNYTSIQSVLYAYTSREKATNTPHALHNYTQT